MLPATAAVGAAPAPSGFSVVELSGDVVLDGPLEYGADVLLRVLPGTEMRPAAGLGGAPALVVRGALHAAGTSEAPIRFHVPLAIRTSSGAAVLEHAVFEPTDQRGCRLTLAAADANVRHVAIHGGEAGLCVEGDSTAPGDTSREAADSAPPPREVIVEGLRVSGAGVGVHLTESAPTVRVSNSTITGNEVGLRADGGRAVLDHVVFADNRRWDVEAARTHNVAWSGSQVEPSCVSIAGRASRGCERGSIGLEPLLLLLGVLVLLSEAGRYALTRLAVWVGLYSRLENAELPNHPARAKLLELVTKSPGMHLRALVAEVGGFGRTAYHLQRLEEAGFLSSRRDGLYRRFYPPGHPLNARASPGTRERVLAAIAARPGIHPGGVAQLLGLSRQLAAYHVAHLTAAGLVLAEPQARRLALRAADPRGPGPSVPPAGAGGAGQTRGGPAAEAGPALREAGRNNS